MLGEVDHLTNKDIDKVKFTAFFNSLFSTDDGAWEGRSSVLEGSDWRDDKLPADFELVRDSLLQLDEHKSMGPNGINPSIWEELADVITGPLLLFNGLGSLERSQLTGTWKICFKFQEG